MVFSYIKNLLGGSASQRQSTASSSPAPKEYYELTSIRCIVREHPRRYELPNANGSPFKGTELNVAVIPHMKPADISCEGLYNIADKGDVLSVLFAKYEIKIMNFESILPVLVINDNTSGYHLIPENIEKTSSRSKGGTEQLETEITQYAQDNLKVTFV